MNTKQQGNITEVSVMLEFLKLGYNVLTPYGDCERYDFVADVNGHFYKIQVKSANDKEEGKITFNCASTHYVDGKCVHDSYTKDEIDYLIDFNYHFLYQQKFLIYVFNQKSLASLRFLPPKNNQTRGIKWAKDYELEEVIKRLG